VQQWQQQQFSPRRIFYREFYRERVQLHAVDLHQ
jgi:hypothetical protein